MRRRDLLAAPLLTAVPLRSQPRSLTTSLASRYLKLTYDAAAGRACLYQRNGSPLLLNVTAAAGFPRDEMLVSDSNYTRSARVEGETLTVTCSDAGKKLDLECRISLLTDRPGAIFEIAAANVSGREVLLRHTEPLRALLDENAGCYFSARQALTHGYMHHDPGSLVELGRPFRSFTSHWNVALHNPSSRATLVVGHLDNADAEGQVSGEGQMTRGGPSLQIGLGLVARSLYNRHFVLKPGARVSSGRVLVLSSTDPFAALETYAEMCGRGVKLNPIVNGWCSWFYTLLEATEDEQLRNAEFVARHLKPYGMEWVQIDDGWQRAFGDWQANRLYPQGMKWLAGRIRGLGLRPGIWIAPHVIEADTEVARNHPDWLLRNIQGELQGTGSSRAKGSFILDITHPGARRWLYDLFRTLRRDWGYDFIKLDFPGWTILAAERFSDPAVSKAQAYRLFLKTVREAVGPDCHLLDCGPGSTGVGLIDSMRVEQDADALDWRHYSGRFNAAAPSTALRYYFHKRTWINDADHLGLARLTIPQAQAAASLIALSGGTVISGDRLTELDNARLDILRKVLPAYGEAARPLDLFEKATPEIFALKVRDGWLLGYFNWDDHAQVTREFDLARLGTDPYRTYLLYEFWSQRLVGEASRTFRLELAPGSVALIAVREKLAVPQVLGTDRHYTQGAVELENVRWDAAARTLSGTALGGRGTAWNMIVHEPSGRLKRVRFEFPDRERVEWSLAFT